MAVLAIAMSTGRPMASPTRRTASPTENPSMPRPSVRMFVTSTMGPGVARTASATPRTSRIGIRLV